MAIVMGIGGQGFQDLPVFGFGTLGAAAVDLACPPGIIRLDRDDVVNNVQIDTVVDHDLGRRVLGIYLGPESHIGFDDLIPGKRLGRDCRANCH